MFGVAPHQEQRKFVFSRFSHENPQNRAKNGEKQLKLSNFKSYRAFHRKLFKVSVGKAPKTDEACPKRKTNDLFAFHSHSINPYNNSDMLAKGFFSHGGRILEYIRYVVLLTRHQPGPRR